MFVFLVVLISILMSRKALAAQSALEEDEHVDGIIDALPLPDGIDISEFDGGKGLRYYLLDSYRKGHSTAKDVCVIAYWAQVAGAHGLSDLALSPNQTGGNFATHLKRAVGIRAESIFYIASVPLWSNTKQERELESFPFLLPHVVFSNMYKKSPHLFDPLNLDPSELPPHWWSHSVLLSHGERAVPVTLYSDGVPHTKNDSFYAWYFQIGSDPTRHLLCSVRKLDLCQCGCRGMCTFGAIQRVLAWSMNAVACGNFPTANHIGEGIEYPELGPLAGGYVGGLIE